MCNRLQKLVGDEWSKEQSMWDGARQFAIEKSVCRACGMLAFAYRMRSLALRAMHMTVLLVHELIVHQRQQRVVSCVVYVVDGEERRRRRRL